jgi:O-antigen ligase/polysaccharide polymerase Wzy-like membrane protein
VSGVALRDPRVVAGRRTAFVAGACAVLALAGAGFALKAPYYGLPLPLTAVAVGIPAWLALTSRHGAALAVALLYMGLVDGFVKLRSNGQAATLGRDVVLYAALAGLAVRSRAPLRLPALGGWVVAWTLVVLVQLANPANTSTFHAVASLRQHLEFVPLFFVGYAMLRSHASLHALFALLLAAAAINGPVGAYQSTLSPKELAAWGPGYAMLVGGDAGRTFDGPDGKPRVRPPGLGSDMGFAGVLGVTALPGGIALLLTYRRRRSLLALVVLGITGAAVGVLTSESRSAIIMAVFALLATLGLMAVARQAKRSLIALCLVGGLAAIAVSAVSSYRSDAFYRYASIAPDKAASTTYESRAGTWAMTPDYIRQIPLGAGLGSVGPAATKAGGAKTAWNAESQFNFLLVETGVPGLVVFLCFQAALWAAILTGLRHRRDPATVVLMAAVSAPLFAYSAGWFFGVNTTSTPNAPYVWLAAGVVSWWLVTPRLPAGRRGPRRA